MNPSNIKISLACKKSVLKCKSQIRKFEIKKEQRVINDNNTGSFCKFINKKLSCKKGVSALHNSAVSWLLTTMKELRLLNDYFASVCTNDNGVIPPVSKKVQQDTLLDNIVFTPEAVYCAIQIVKK